MIEQISDGVNHSEKFAKFMEDYFNSKGCKLK